MKKSTVAFLSTSLLLFSMALGAAAPKARDFPNETEVKGNCDSNGNNCKNIAVSFRLDPNIPGSGPEFASSECAERRMLPLDVERVWTKSGGAYGTRIWMVMCEKP